MRKRYIQLFALISILFFLSIKISAINYTINFTGSGAASSVDSVIVQNLTQGTKVTVPIGNVLVLSDQPNGVEQIISTNETLHLVPYGGEGKYSLSFYSKNPGITQINVYSMDGRKIAGIATNLQAGINSFQLLLPKGLYALHVSGNGYAYSSKLTNLSGTTGRTGITYIGSDNSQVSTQQKSKKSFSTIQLNYVAGDRLLYKGFSGNFCTIVTDVPAATKTMNFEFIECKDASGNYYSVVKIGSQTWMAENLKTTKYRNGDEIINFTNNSDWGMYAISSWCNYNNDATNSNKLGKLYNWYAVFDSRNITPLGWHVASDADWTMLTTFLGGEIISGGKLKETDLMHWGTPNSSATNESGYTALPCGSRLTSGQFDNLGINGNWWSLTDNGVNYAWYRYLTKGSAAVVRDYYNKNAGFSVRCVKDATIPTVITTVPASITYTTAIGGGEITSDGGAPITACGVCWSTSSNPTILNSKSNTVPGLNTFKSSITGLNINATYYVRAFATNISGTAYGDQITFNSLPYDSIKVTDADGNLYHSITIGSQKWMVENLKTTKYRNGEIIGTTSSLNMDLTYAVSPKYQWAYYGQESNVATYGRLYTWYAVADSRNIAPVGWHVASDAEWSVLQNYMISNGYNYDKTTIDNKIANSLCTTTLWNASSIVGTPGYDMSYNNSSGFSMVSGGYRGFDGYYYIIGNGTDIWTSTEFSSNMANAKGCAYNCLNLGSNTLNKNYGFSVRCLKNTLPTLSTSIPNSIMSTSTNIGGTIPSDGGEAVTEYGVCWNTSESPTIAESHKSLGSGIGSFTGSLTGLAPNTTYYIRIYAINSLGTAYGEQMSFKTLEFDPPTITDADGNLYHSITIGTQTWMLENLKTTKYRNGDVIGTTSTLNLDLTYATTPKYQWAYNGIESNVTPNGRLYTWHVVADSRNIAPAGWHVATDSEWSTLQSYLITNGYNYDKTNIDNKIAKSLCSTTGWSISTIIGTAGYELLQNNNSGFSIVPGGYRGFDGYYYLLGNGTDIWTSTENSSTLACARWCGYNSVSLSSNNLNKNYGFSVRCIKNGLPIVSTTTPISILSTSFTCGGNVSADGGETVTEFGVCWNTSESPTIIDSHKSLGSGMGSFTASITSLVPGTTYYLRAYATNNLGTAYGDQLTLKTLVSDPVNVTDIDGNIYHTITIGTQTWMVENLKTTKYNDGTPIPLITDGYQWTGLSTPGYCWINNDSNNKNLYGGLYNFFAVNTNKLAPVGWHVPTESDWNTLTTYFGGPSIAGLSLKETGTVHWYSPNTGATNSSGFTALPGGYRTITDGNYINFGTRAIYWGSTELNGSAGRYVIENNSTITDFSYTTKTFGFSIRCIKN
ncbi:MAG: FISUMP domain-containing protein [Paludibacter sp.]|nr:FISUMP domain-containing protein [Paludibacter sp.]